MIDKRNYESFKESTNISKLTIVMNPKSALLFFSLLVTTLQGKSSKKGLCIPPGDNFHCGDLAAFTNVRWVSCLKQVEGHAKPL